MKVYDSITPELSSWLLAQSVFFVASAPHAGVHINVSPKGLPASSLAVLGPRELAYVDATGSGCETVAHLRENARLTVMLCSFGPAPRILRLFTRGEVVEAADPSFRPLLARMRLLDDQARVEGARAIMHLHVFKVTTACGYGVPKLALSNGLKQEEGDEEMDGEEPSIQPFLQDRETLGHWANNKISKGELLSYQSQHNHESLDGLPGLRSALRSRSRLPFLVDTRFWMSRHRTALHLLVAALVGAVAAVLGLWTQGMLNLDALTTV